MVDARPDDAIADFNTALALDPKSASALNSIGQLSIIARPSQSIRFTRSHSTTGRKGKALAEKNCSWCHAVGSAGDSPNPKSPQFRNMQSRHPLLALRVPLSRGIAALHDQMPRFKLVDSEIDEIVAYINSLKASN